MRKKKYKNEKYGGVLIIFLIILTVYFSVKCEQQQLLEKMELQTEEVILQSGEKIKSIGSDVINDRKEAENDIEESITNQDLKLGNDSEIQAEDEKNNEIWTEDEEIPVCDIVRAMDFTVKKPQLDITPDENRIYLEGYLKVLKNEIPLIWEDEVKYYKDLWKAGTEFEELLKEKDTREYPWLYYYDDLDGDGKPEFAIDQGCMFLFKYEKELDQCRVLYFEEACYFQAMVGAGQIWRHDGLHANIVRNDLIGLDEEGGFQYILRLEEGSVPEHHYFQVGVSDVSLHYVKESEEEWGKFVKPFFEYTAVSEEEWNEITQPFFEMVENNAVPQKTLEEVFGELLDEDTKG